MARIVVLAVVYFAAAKLGLSMAVSAEQVSAVWPPTGVALSAVLVFGFRMWPGIAFGAFTANITANEPIGTAAGIAIGNTLEAIIGAWLLQRWIGFDRRLSRLKDVLALIGLAAAASTSVSATIGVSSLCLGGVYPWADFGALWSVWWLGDGIGDLIIAPALLTATIGLPRWTVPRAAEAGGLALALVVTGIIVFYGWTGSASYYSLAYAVFPFVVWAALRFGPQGTAVVVLVASILALSGTLRGAGPFGSGTTHDRLVAIQVFMGVVAVTALILSAALAERYRDEHYRSLLHGVADVLADSSTLSHAAPRIIERICEILGWQIGAMWHVDHDSNNLSCAGVWHVGSATFPEFEAITRQARFPKGIGLPGRVWDSGKPAWIPDVVHDPNFPRAQIAMHEGLHGAFGFPIRLGEETHGVMEFFSAKIRRPDEDLLQIMGTIGSQLGQFIERRHGDQEVHRSEALKAAVLESALDAIITIDHRGAIVEFNPAAERMFGWPRSEAIGKVLVDLIIPQSLKGQHEQGLRRYLATGHGPVLDKRIESRAVRSDGTEFPVELAITRIPLPGPAMFTGYIRDIAERLRLEEELRTRAEQLLAADRRKNEFLATLAHELRNPLAPLRNGLQILRLGHADPAAMQEARAMMERQLSQMVHLIDDLLDLSRISRGTVELRKQRTELAKVVEQAVETSRPLIEQASHHLSVNLPPSPIYVDCDITRLAQVFCNLLNNAAKYTERGGHIWLTIQRDNGEAVVTVRDDGIGIPAEMLPNVFDMFAQIDQNLERSQGGLGIGLSIVQRLVDLHGGTVEAKSNGNGMGSEFVVRLPVVLSVVLPQPENGKVTPACLRRRILVVDDNGDAAVSLAMMLKFMGNETQTAFDGFEALAMGATFRPDIILLDIGMPKLNGYETAKRIRNQAWGKSVVLAALTGWGLDDDRRKSQEAGFDFHLVKPIEPAALEEILVSSHGATG
jgi:PAS domain S-box-containing protein